MIYFQSFNRSRQITHQIDNIIIIQTVVKSNKIIVHYIFSKFQSIPTNNISNLFNFKQRNNVIHREIKRTMRFAKFRCLENGDSSSRYSHVYLHILRITRIATICLKTSSGQSSSVNLSRRHSPRNKTKHFAKLRRLGN